MEMCSLEHALTTYTQDHYGTSRPITTVIIFNSLQSLMHPPRQILLQQPAHPTHLSGLQQAFWCACCSAFAFWAACASPSVFGTTSSKLLCLLASACSRLLLAASCLVCLYAAAWQVHLAGIAHAASAGCWYRTGNGLSLFCQ